jgi:DNA-binding Lrp family transcriptional regulator
MDVMSCSNNAELQGDIIMTEEALTIPAKHIFLDVVDYSHERSVEAQSYIVAFLNRIVLLSLEKNGIQDKDRLLLPTGDGMCISLLNVISPYDIHLRLALSVLKYLDHFLGQGIEQITGENADTEKVTLVLVDDSEEYLSRIRMREFKVRIGIDANIDNLVTDINGGLNIAGAGINTAQRIMGLADGNQILLSDGVVNELRQREQYMRAFLELPSIKVKHGKLVRPFQFVGHGYEGLNTERPSAFPVATPQQPQQPKTLTKIAAYYFAQAIRHRDFLLKRDSSSSDYTGEVLLYLLAKDSVAKSEAVTERQKTYFNQNKLVKKTLDDSYQELNATSFTILNIVHERLGSIDLSGFTQYFEGYDDYRFLTSEGGMKLKQEWPDIWAELESDGVVPTSQSA